MARIDELEQRVEEIYTSDLTNNIRAKYPDFAKDLETIEAYIYELEKAVDQLKKQIK